MKRYLFVLIIASAVLSSCVGVKVGEPLPGWKKGELDIHFINTGRGECTWQILPDGTTFLVDASGQFEKVGPNRYDAPPARPSADISSGKVIIDYINHFSPAVSKGHIDYFLLTHHHGDHAGDIRKELPLHESGLFCLSSFPEIGSNLIVDRIFDRDTSFSYPTPASQDNALMNNYRAFLDWTKSVNGTELLQWKIGSDSQIVPLHDPSCGVVVRNYSANGSFWTGQGEETYSIMPTREEFEAGDVGPIPNENCLSCSYILSYGDFDFFLGGDLQYNQSNMTYDIDKYPYLDTETPLADVVHKVEVMKANHHAELGTQHPALMAALHPDVVMVGCRYNLQPNPETVDFVLAENPECDIFATNLTDYNIPRLGEERLARIYGNGHVVVRVAKGGKSYMVYMLDDTDQEYRVKSVHGPYQCAE